MSTLLSTGRPLFLAARQGANRIITALAEQSPLESQWLASHLESRQMLQSEILAAVGAPFEHVYFPETAVMSVISRMSNGDAAEVGTIGNEGMVGVDVFLGAGV